jgi:hypothetical protein
MLHKGKQFTLSQDSEEENIEKVWTRKKRRIAYKWQLFALLARNPSLMKFRKHNIINDSEIDKNTQQHILDKKANFYEKKKAYMDNAFNDSETVGFKK